MKRIAKTLGLLLVLLVLLGALAQQLGVSRAPVREAMMQLEREGLLTFDKRGAAFVKEFTADDLEEIYSLRLTLETMAARLACAANSIRRSTAPMCAIPKATSSAPTSKAKGCANAGSGA